MTNPMRVFGVGLGKTGTESLNQALTMLGFPAIHYPDPGLMLAGRFDEALVGFRAATDISVAAVYRELDRAYPGSRFILTLRDLPGWLESVGRQRRGHLGESESDPRALVRRRLYGSPTFDPDLYAAGYNRHIREVRAHFRDRAELLIMDICAGEEWERLCAFLGVPVPAEPFPEMNDQPVAAA